MDTTTPQPSPEMPTVTTVTNVFHGPTAVVIDRIRHPRPGYTRTWHAELTTADVSYDERVATRTAYDRATAVRCLVEARQAIDADREARYRRHSG